MADRRPPPRFRLRVSVNRSFTPVLPSLVRRPARPILVACGMQRVRAPGEAVELDQPADRSIAVLLLPCLPTSCNPFGFVLDRGMRVVRPARTCRAFLIRCHPGRARRSSDREVAGCARPCLCAKRSAPTVCVRALLLVCALLLLSLTRSDRPSLHLPSPHSSVCGRVLGTRWPLGSMQTSGSGGPASSMSSTCLAVTRCS